MADVVVRAAESPADVDAAYALRHEVFVGEQQVPVEIERDELDEAATHVVAFDGDRCVGAGRLVAADGIGVVGRMAVHAGVRGRGVGQAVLRQLEEAARAAGLGRIELHAQAHAVGFYDGQGYVTYGAPFDEAGIEHVHMRKTL